MSRLCPLLRSLVLALILLLVVSSLWAEAANRAPASGQLAAGYLTQLVGGLVLVILAIVILAWFLRRVPGVGGQGHGVIRILAVRNIGARERLMVVQVGDEQILIGVTPTGMRRLHTLAKPIEPVAEEPWSGDFASLLKRVKSGGSQ